MALQVKAIGTQLMESIGPTIQSWRDKHPKIAAVLAEAIKQYLPRCKEYEQAQAHFATTHPEENMEEWEQKILEILVANAVLDQIAEIMPLQEYLNWGIRRGTGYVLLSLVYQRDTKEGT